MSNVDGRLRIKSTSRVSGNVWLRRRFFSVSVISVTRTEKHCSSCTIYVYVYSKMSKSHQNDTREKRRVYVPYYSSKLDLSAPRSNTVGRHFEFNSYDVYLSTAALTHTYVINACKLRWRIVSASFRRVSSVDALRPVKLTETVTMGKKTKAANPLNRLVVIIRKTKTAFTRVSMIVCV